MTKITEQFKGFTMINTFSPPAERAEELKAVLIRATEEFMRHVDGFVSANFHFAVDGSNRVVNYVQWASEKHFKKVFAGDAWNRWFEPVNEYAPPDVLPCRVAYVSGERLGVAHGDVR